jgi:hypothetical protein
MNTISNIKVNSFLVLILFIGLTGNFEPVTAQDNIIHPEGNLELTSPDDFWPQIMTGSTFNEFWTYHFYLDNDLEITLVYSLANFGSLKSPVSGARASILGFGDRNYQVLREFPLDRLVQDEDNYRIQMRPDREIWFEGKLPGNHKISFVTSKDGVDYDIKLVLTNIQQGYKWGDGIFSIDGSRVGIVTHIPYARVRGTVRINDREQSVRGSAYMDHVFQDKITTRLFSDGFRFVHHTNQNQWEAGHFLGSDRRDEHNVIGYALSKDNGEVTLKKPVRLIRSESERVFGHSLPKNIRIEFDDSTNRTVERIRDRERFEMLQELGRLARRLARSYLRGEVVEFRGEARFISGESDEPVRYNYFIVD